MDFSQEKMLLVFLLVSVFLMVFHFRCNLKVSPRNSMGVFLFQRFLGVIFSGVDYTFSLWLNSVFLGSLLATVTFQLFSEYFTGLFHGIPLVLGGFPQCLLAYCTIFHCPCSSYFHGVCRRISWLSAVLLMFSRYSIVFLINAKEEEYLIPLNFLAPLIFAL